MNVEVCTGGKWRNRSTAEQRLPAPPLASLGGPGFPWLDLGTPHGQSATLDRASVDIWENLLLQPDAIAFTGALVWRYPELLEQFGAHLEDNAGEVLPHVFMAKVERWARDLLAERRQLLIDVLAELERALSTERDAIVNLIDVSFVENLPYAGESAAEIRDLLPPGLRGLLRH